MAIYNIYKLAVLAMIKGERFNLQHLNIIHLHLGDGVLLVMVMGSWMEVNGANCTA